MGNVVPEGLRSLTIRVLDVKVGDRLEDRYTGLAGTVAAVHVSPKLVILEMVGALDWRFTPGDLVQLRYRSC
jgi:hypothetical protein